MKKIILAIIVTVMAFSGAYAQDRGTKFVVTDTIQSTKIGVPRAYTVVLPASYYTQKDKAYPVLYLLHGMYGDNEDWESKASVREVAHQLARSGEAREMIIVSPNAGGRNAEVEQNGYFNMPGWPYEDFFFEELIPEIEKKYRVRTGRENRAVAGLSMGGGGSTSYAQRHPDMFSSVYAMSALMDLKIPENEKADPQNKVHKFYLSAVQNSCVDFVKNADDATKEALRGIAWYVDCGDDDFLLDPNIAFYQAMRNAGIPCEFRVRDGMHDWLYWHSALFEALPFVSRNFAPEK